MESSTSSPDGARNHIAFHVEGEETTRERFSTWQAVKRWFSENPLVYLPCRFQPRASRDLARSYICVGRLQMHLVRLALWNWLLRHNQRA
jgi:hypothetical protein